MFSLTQSQQFCLTANKLRLVMSVYFVLRVTIGSVASPLLLHISTFWILWAHYSKTISHKAHYSIKTISSTLLSFIYIKKKLWKKDHDVLSWHFRVYKWTHLLDWTTQHLAVGRMIYRPLDVVMDGMLLGFRRTTCQCAPHLPVPINSFGWVQEYKPLSRVNLVVFALCLSLLVQAKDILTRPLTKYLILPPLLHYSGWTACKQIKMSQITCLWCKFV